MNYLRKYLSTNLQLRSVHEKIFNWGPMPIDHLAHRTFKNDKICNEYTSSDSSFRLQNDRFNFKHHNAYAEWWHYNGNKFDNQYINSLFLFDKSIIGTPNLFISTYAGLDCDKSLKDSKIDLEHIQWNIDNPTGLLSYNLYEQLYKKNQYLAWTLAHRKNINHIGIEVQNIEKIAEKVSEFLPLNNPESPIQISEDGNLLQCSTKSTVYPYKFEEGHYDIPYNFIEFIERKNGREGFSEKNANIVFNSTTK